MKRDPCARIIAELEAGAAPWSSHGRHQASGCNVVLLRMPKDTRYRAQWPSPYEVKGCRATTMPGIDRPHRQEPLLVSIR
jgi:hypothetical protein